MTYSHFPHHPFSLAGSDAQAHAGRRGIVRAEVSALGKVGNDLAAGLPRLVVLVPVLLSVLVVVNVVIIELIGSGA